MPGIGSRGRPYIPTGTSGATKGHVGFDPYRRTSSTRSTGRYGGSIDKAIDELLNPKKKQAGPPPRRGPGAPGVSPEDAAQAGSGATTAGGGAAAGGGTAKPPKLDFEAELDPYIQRQIERYEQRFDVDNTQRAIDRANLGIADAAALSAADARAANLSRRGILGSATGDVYLQKRIFEPARRQAAEAAADIAFANEQRLDQLVLGGTGLMTAPSAIALQQQRLGLDAWSRAQEDARLRAAMEQSAEAARRAEELARLQMILNLADDYGSEGYY
jgi:hypothetical protein